MTEKNQKNKTFGFHRIDFPSKPSAIRFFDYFYFTKYAKLTSNFKHKKSFQKYKTHANTLLNKHYSLTKKKRQCCIDLKVKIIMRSYEKKERHCI